MTETIVVPKQNWLARNERKILLTCTVITTTAVAILIRATKEHNKFLEEKGLTEEFYALNEE